MDNDRNRVKFSKDELMEIYRMNKAGNNTVEIAKHFDIDDLDWMSAVISSITPTWMQPVRHSSGWRTMEVYPGYFRGWKTRMEIMRNGPVETKVYHLEYGIHGTLMFTKEEELVKQVLEENERRASKTDSNQVAIPEKTGEAGQGKNTKGSKRAKKNIPGGIY